MSSDLREPFARDLAEVRALRPKWEGLHSFNEVWEACIAVGLEPEIAEGSRTYSTRSGVARRAARVMRTAHPINFGSAQLSAVHGLCLNDGANPFEFLREHRGPFDKVFLDYSAVAANPTLLSDRPGHAQELFGAAYWRLAGDAATIVPFGSGVHRDSDGDHSVIGVVYPDGEYATLPAAASLGALMILNSDDLDPTEMAFFVSRHSFPGSDGIENEIRGVVPVCAIPDLIADYFREEPVGWEWLREVSADVVATVGGQPDMARCIGEGLPLQDLPEDTAFAATELPHKAARSMLADAMVVVFLSLAVIDSLYFLESHNVTIEDAQVSRQVRRQAERSGGEIRIAQTVRVGPTKVRREPREGKGGTANYSHRFERRGYTRHVTKGSHAKADLIRPCYRRDAEGNLTCPDGCRREWVPPTIVGDEDLPFVPKSRILPGPNMEN